MPSPEKNFGERTGETVRNVGIGLLAISIFLYPALFFSGVIATGGGEVYRRANKPSK